MRLPRFGSFARQPLGLDLQTDRLTLVQLGPPRGTPSVLQAFHTAHHGADDPDARRAALETAWRTLDTSNRHVAIALTSEVARFRLLQIPATLPHSTLRAVLRSEADSLFDAAAGETSMAYQWLPANPAAADTERNVLLCVAPMQQVETLAAAVRRSGLRVAQIQIDLFARLNAWAAIPHAAALQAGRRFALHVETTRIVWHVLPPGALVPEPAARVIDLGTDAAGNAELANACAQLGANSPDAILLSGEVATVQRLRQALPTRFPHCKLLANPFASAPLAPGLDRLEVTRCASDLVQAYGLAAGG